MINYLKQILFGKKVNINHNAALEIARNFCTQKNYKWNEPVSVNLSRGVYSIWTNGNFRGNNFWIKIDGSNGEIISQGITPV